jgi:hypothetical protein
MTRLRLVPFNEDVYRVLDEAGTQVGNLKRIGEIWKLKAIGHDAEGRLVPGGGPLTGRHNAVFAAPDERELNLRLLGGPP